MMGVPTGSASSTASWYSAATYSGPAAIRFQRGACGQQEHTELYSPAPDGCYLMTGLKDAGFETQLALNHDGHFDNFLQFVQGQLKTPVTPMPLTALPVTQRSFDGTPILDDKAMLTKWLTGRAANPASQVALYYNSISLHDGNRMEGSQDNMHSLESFKPRLSKLLDDIDDFLVQLEKSGRRAVVVMVPEHGAAVRGDKMQIAGLREMPSRAITLVPVGIRVIGPEIRRSGDSVRTDATTSYLAVSKIVANMLEVSPFKDAFHPADYLKDLPHTRFVAQNADVIVMQSGDRDYIKQGKEKWTEYKAGQ